MLPRRASHGYRPRHLAGLLALLLIVSCVPALSAQSDGGSAAAFSGTWKMREGDLEAQGMEWVGELRIRALDERRLLVEFMGHFAEITPRGPNANFGDMSAIAVVSGRKTSFRSADGECDFLLRLRGDVLEAGQTGSGCYGFGMRVTATGTYRRIRAGRPPPTRSER